MRYSGCPNLRFVDNMSRKTYNILVINTFCIFAKNCLDVFYRGLQKESKRLLLIIKCYQRIRPPLV